MPPKPLFGLNEIDLSNVIAGPADIRKYNRQRYEMEHLDAVVLLDLEGGRIAGYKDVRADEFWVRGHIPGNPLLPGVVMCEAGAQLLSYFFSRATETGRFVVFGGMDGVKFRQQVRPGQRLVLLGTKQSVQHRRWNFNIQGFVDGKLAFEGLLYGIPVESNG
jgi:3-hydroxyacyl-[acyl-carrier-protein] dehydratase